MQSPSNERAESHPLLLQGSNNPNFQGTCNLELLTWNKGLTEKNKHCKQGFCTVKLPPIRLWVPLHPRTLTACFVTHYGMSGEYVSVPDPYKIEACAARQTKLQWALSRPLHLSRKPNEPWTGECNIPPLFSRWGLEQNGWSGAGRLLCPGTFLQHSIPCEKSIPGALSSLSGRCNVHCNCHLHVELDKVEGLDR